MGHRLNKVRWSFTLSVRTQTYPLQLLMNLRMRICLSQNYVSNGTCFYITPLPETLAWMVAPSLQCLLGKVVFLNVSSMPGLVFIVHFPNTIEKDLRIRKQHMAPVTHGQELISHLCN